MYAVCAAMWLVVRRGAVSLRAAIVIAIVLRAMFLFAEPRLSGDVYRYLWDGQVFASGVNPYRLAPSSFAGYDTRINYPEIRTIYPPHAQLLFLFVHQLTLWRLLLIACEIATLVLLPRPLALAYATFPPLLFEGAWSGHIEIAAALLLTVAVLRRSPVAAAIAGGLKISPIAAFPALARTWSWRGIVVYLAVLLIPFAIFAAVGPLMPGFRDYATRWIFNSPAYAVVFPLIDVDTAKDLWTAIKDPLHLEPISDFVYRHLYPDFVTRVFLALFALSLIVRAKDPLRQVGALLFFSPAIHPWYWLVIAPLAMLERSALVWVALCAPFSYLLYAGAPPLVVFALCYGIPLIVRLRPSATATSGAGWPRAETRPRTARDTSPS